MWSYKLRVVDELLLNIIIDEFSKTFEIIILHTDRYTRNIATSYMSVQNSNIGQYTCTVVH